MQARQKMQNAKNAMIGRNAKTQALQRLQNF